jgi:hypothetical protein
VEDILKVFGIKIITDVGSIYWKGYKNLLNRIDVVPDLKEKTRVDELLHLYTDVCLKSNYEKDMDMVK